ncbi:hypothetical protein M1L60_21845 [Actinoplanes sp. TRM 88003]|uniref:Lipoprotein n=1 Tax=Paractinoplanes aksuensis TaxID=2939490 RepID=A0ABT1DQW9_9ACTN|nr:hypothetical protein [Actinoplanes aksuensis]MCO8273239.1 hypothetical protein [Actinoplanes aksuensis]
MLTTIVLATLTACGSFDPATSDSSASSADDFSLGPQVTVTFDLTGAEGLKGKQTALAPMLDGSFAKSCADYAKGTKKDDGKTLYAIGGLYDGPVDGKKVTLELWIDDYAGPGTYPKDQLVAPGSRPSIAIDNTIFGTWPESTSSKVTTDAKGGGTWTFKKLATTAPGGLPGEAVDGTVKWTCRED